MDIVMGWLSKIDVTAIIAAVVSFGLGLAFVKAKLGKALSVLGDVADLLSCLKKSLEDGKLSKDEIDQVVIEANELVAEFKK